MKRELALEREELEGKRGKGSRMWKEDRNGKGIGSRGRHSERRGGKRKRAEERAAEGGDAVIIV